MAPILSRLTVLGGGGNGGFGFGKRRGKRFRRIISSFSSPGSVSIPAQATSVIVEAHGASRGAQSGASVDVKSGGYCLATFSTLNGQTLNVNFGGAGFPPATPSFANEGCNYAGVFNGPVSHGNSLVIAGGSAQPGSPNLGIPYGGAGGGLIGQSGDNGTRSGDSNGTAATGGGGGTQSAGGAGGIAGQPRTPQINPGNGSPGSALQGGAGSGLGGTAVGSVCPGGGGGYYGGGGGASGHGWAPYVTGGTGPSVSGFGQGSAGGGGSSYIHPSAISSTNTQEASSYIAGYVEITYVEPQ